MCGNTLGEYSFIAAGSVVVNDVPPFALMVGVPARRVGWMVKQEESWGKFGCPIDGTNYHLRSTMFWQRFKNSGSF